MVSEGLGRNLFERPIHWEYFYDRYGKALVRLYRIMGTLRRTYRAAFTNRGSFYYYNAPNHYQQGLIVIRREIAAGGGQPAENLMVFINFSGVERDAWFAFPKNGSWVEQIDKDDAVPRPTINVTFDGQWHCVKVPSYYGCIYALI